MDDVSLKTGLSLALTMCRQTVPGLGSRDAPQTAGFEAGPYTYGASGEAAIDQVIWMSFELAASATLTVNLLTGTATNPLGETARLDVLKELCVIALPTDHADAETATEGVTAAFSADAAAAAGFAAGFTKTLARGESIADSYPAGRAVAGTPTILFTNLSAAGKACVLLVAAGFKP